MYSEESAVTWQSAWGTEHALDKCFFTWFPYAFVHAGCTVGVELLQKRNSECGW